MNWKTLIPVFGALMIFRSKSKAESTNNSTISNQTNSNQIKVIVKELITHKSKEYKSRSLSQINEIIIHHSATVSGSPKSYANYHVNTNDWPGIGYHYVIQKNGEIFQTNYLETISYHTSGQNRNSIGICLTGNFDIQQPSSIQVESLKNLIQYLRKKMGHLPIAGHRHYSTKSCPGHNINFSNLNIV